MPNKNRAKLKCSLSFKMDGYFCAENIFISLKHEKSCLENSGQLFLKYLFAKY